MLNCGQIMANPIAGSQGRSLRSLIPLAHSLRTSPHPTPCETGVNSISLAANREACPKQPDGPSVAMPSALLVLPVQTVGLARVYPENFGYRVLHWPSDSGGSQASRKRTSLKLRASASPASSTSRPRISKPQETTRGRQPCLEL